MTPADTVAHIRRLRRQAARAFQLADYWRGYADDLAVALEEERRLSRTLRGMLGDARRERNAA